MLTLSQKIYLIQCYGIGEKSYRRIAEEFNAKFPEVTVSRMGIRKLVKKFLETGSVLNLKKKKIVRDEDDASTVLILDSVQDNPKLSLRRRALQLNMSKSHIQRVLKERKLYPYKPIFNHTLEPGDDEKRLYFCMWMGDEIMENQNFHKSIVFSDEATFSSNGTVSSQHVRYWSDTNPHFRIASKRQYFVKVNVWCAVSYHGIIGPYFFDANVNQHNYLEMLSNFFWDGLSELPLAYRQRMYFQQDGCPAHRSRIVAAWLNQKFENNWIGWNGPVLWPPRSPDLTILDFYLWGRLKQLVYMDNVPNNVEVLKNRIRDAVASLTLEEIRNSYKELRLRVELCAERGGDLIE